MKVSIDIHSHVELLQEAVRTFLHQGSISSLLSHIAKGVAAYEQEGKVQVDRELAVQFWADLEAWAVEWRSCDEEVHNPASIEAIRANAEKCSRNPDYLYPFPCVSVEALGTTE